MEAYRYQQFAYLVVPAALGIEFFVTARAERKREGGELTRAVMMDVFGYVFVALIPALFLFTITSLEYKRFFLMEQLLHRMDRYGVMFMFLGAWWQVFLITSLRAKRLAGREGGLFLAVWAPYLLFGAFISALILWVAPFNLMWVSVFWFLASYGLCGLIGFSAATVSKIFLVLAIITVVCENVLFIILDAIV